jgi:nicotinamide phosphoribosyltransferase
MNNIFNPMLLTDFYKIGHPFQYPKGITKVYSNLTPRKSRIKDVNKMTFFGLQYFIKEYLITQFNENFFNRDLDEVITEYKRVINNTIGELSSYQHIIDLHKLGYLPIEIKALPEGVEVDMRVPVVTIVNTLPEFYWVTNFIETLLTASTWQTFTSATISKEYRKLLNNYADLTGMPSEFIQWQGHDFSFRRMSSLESAMISGMGHLVFFTGTDSIPSILALEKYYNADVTQELIGGSVNASEHSVMCAGGKEDELQTYKRLLSEVYPNGILSLVSDTYDLFKVCTEYMTELKDVIVNRDGKLVIRPDSGDPVEILCGMEQIDINELTKDYNGNNKLEYGFNLIKQMTELENKEYLVKYKESDQLSEPSYFKIKINTDLNYNKIISFYDTYKSKYKTSSLSERYSDDYVSPKEELETNGYEYYLYTPSNAELGVVELLWNVFGGTITDKGYKLLDSHIGVIYGDSITLDRADNICRRLMNKGFASQVVFGIGSYTFQYNTRDTFGIAVKGTYVEIDGVGQDIFKDPITDDGTKKSAVGLLRVEKENGNYVLYDKQTIEQSNQGELKTVFLNGKLIKDWTLQEVKGNSKL